MKKILQLIKIMLRKEVTTDDIVNWWLIVFKWTNLEEQEKIHTESRDFHSANQVKNWQYNIWMFWAVGAIRRMKRQWFWERRFPFFSVYSPKRSKIRNDWGLTLNCSPSIKDYNKVFIKQKRRLEFIDKYIKIWKK